MSDIRVIARLKIHEGKREEFESITQQCIDSVREKDTGTLLYNWYYNADKSECVVHEHYKDSNAVLEHMGNLGGLLDALFSASDLGAIEVYGTPSEELAAAVAALQPAMHTLLNGM